MNQFLILFAAVLLLGGPSEAQTQLPGAVDAGPTPLHAPAVKKPARPKASPDDDKTSPDAAAAPSDEKKPSRGAKHETGLASVVDRPLLLNGTDGQLQMSYVEKKKGLKIDKFTLLGEVVSNPGQKCQIDIVADAPIEAKSQGAPEGLTRYSVDIPACPLTFDLLDGAVLVPPQPTACVFQAADCQAIPSGLWGPAGASLDADVKAIAHERSRAESSIATSLKILQKRDKAGVAALAQEQSDFAAQRDDLCRGYADEAKHGFCDAELSLARAIKLHKRTQAAKLSPKQAVNDND